MKLKIYTDGGSRGNPGPAAAGYVISDQNDQLLEEGGLYLGVTTNNQAEYRAVKLALEKASKYQPEHIDLYLDSELVVKQLMGLYKIKNVELKPVIEDVKQLLGRYDYTIQHVRREYNQEADRQVNIVLDQQG
ncbi:ribonuclease HI family protein [Candidatus Microgenomates bacterium]|nr:ribonuclease HI family protein [Candidatus Microgenomates bacterium]